MGQTPGVPREAAVGGGWVVNTVMGRAVTGGHSLWRLGQERSGGPGGGDRDRVGPPVTPTVIPQPPGSV